MLGRKKLTEPTRLWYSTPAPLECCHQPGHAMQGPIDVVASSMSLPTSVSPPRWETRDPSHQPQPDRTCPLWAGTGPC